MYSETPEDSCSLASDFEILVPRVALSGFNACSGHSKLYKHFQVALGTLTVLWLRPLGMVVKPLT